MILLFFSILWATIVALLIRRAVGQYAAYEQLHDETGDAPPWQAPRVNVIVPARNESENIRHCLGALVAQRYPADSLRVTVVDDRSCDDTAEVVREFSRQYDFVTLCPGGALPRGWKGKPFACWQGIQSLSAGADDRDDSWLCFVDADTRAAPPLLKAAVSLADARGIDMLSLEPFQELLSFWERLLIPVGFILLAFFQDLRRANDPCRNEATANGQFILIRRRTYQRVGGHAAVRAEIAEDSALARLVKQSGFRIAVVGAESMLTTRMYHGLDELWEGISKNLIEMAGGTGRTIFVGAAGIVLAIAAVALPVMSWLAVIRPDGATAVHWAAAGLATAATASLVGMHTGAAAYLRIPLWYGLLFPVGYVAGAALAATSLWMRARGYVRWKGRIYVRYDEA